MSSKRKTSAPTRVLVDVDTCHGDATADDHNTDLPADHELDAAVSVAPDRDDDSDRSLKVVTSPSSLSDDDVTLPDDVRPEVGGATCEEAESPQRQWLGAEVAGVLAKIEAVIAAARTLDEKRLRVDEMLTELETIRLHLLTAASDDSASFSHVSAL